MVVYRAIRRGTIFKSLIGREPFFLAQKRHRTEEIRHSGGWAYDVSRISESSVIVSFGLGEDVRFELDMIRDFDCQVFGFDPTPRSVNYVRNAASDPRFRAREVALSDYDGEIVFQRPPKSSSDQVSCSAYASYGDDSAECIRVPCLTLESALKSSGIEHVDLLKLDIEGAEYCVLTQAIRMGWLSRIPQLLVEFHHFLPGITARQTRNAVQELKKSGFRIGWIGNTNHEYLFLR